MALATNIEIKARARDFSRQVRLAEELADGETLLLNQQDTFFEVPTGQMEENYRQIIKEIRESRAGNGKGGERKDGVDEGVETDGSLSGPDQA